MRQRIISVVRTVITVLSVCVFFLTPLVPVVNAQDCTATTQDMSIQEGANCARGNEQPSNLFGGNGSIFNKIANVLLFLVGAIAVIMLIIGGIRYVISGGDQAQVSAAKNTILYAIIGIIVAFLSYAAINFITRMLSGVNAT